MKQETKVYGEIRTYRKSKSVKSVLYRGEREIWTLDPEPKLHFFAIEMDYLHKSARISRAPTQNECES